MLLGLRVVFYIHLHLDDIKIARKGRALRPFFFNFSVSVISIFLNKVLIAELYEFHYFYKRFF